MECDFDWKFYCQYYPDLIKAKINTEALARNHYLKNGKKEKRFVNPSQVECYGAQLPKIIKKSDINQSHTIVYDLAQELSLEQIMEMNPPPRIIFKRQEKLYCLIV